MATERCVSSRTAQVLTVVHTGCLIARRMCASPAGLDASEQIGGKGSCGMLHIWTGRAGSGIKAGLMDTWKLVPERARTNSAG